MQIKLTGKNRKDESITTTIIIPINPEEINVQTSGRFQSYEIINRGLAKVPNGEELFYVSWESFFPGSGLKGMPFITGEYQDPKAYHRQLDYWRRKGEKVRVMITTTPIDFDAYIESYDYTFKGANGDIYYNIEFSKAVDVTIKTVPKKPGQTSGNDRGTGKTETYPVKPGDCLWSIAKKLLGSGTKWRTIYDANKATIEAAAKKHGKSSSSNGHWIYPGTVLKIPGAGATGGGGGGNSTIAKAGSTKYNPTASVK